MSTQKSLIFINQVKNFLPRNSMRKLYFALVHSHYTYGLYPRGNTLYRSIVLQKRALRIINNANYNGHTDPRFKTSRILRLNYLYEYQALMFIFDYITNTLLISFANTFQIDRGHLDLRQTSRYTLLDVYYNLQEGHLPTPSLIHPLTRSLTQLFDHKYVIYLLLSD